VTGASRGIGAAIVKRLVADGWDVTLSARTAAALAELAESLGPAGGQQLTAVPADMAVSSDISQLARRHEHTFGRLDALVLNAGMGSIGPIAEFPLRRLDKLFAVNVRAAYQLMQECLPLLRTTATSSPFGARVVAVSSLTGLVGEPLNSAYGATKAALISLCETLTTEESERGVNATAICPGYVATDMTAQLSGPVAHRDMIPAVDVAEMVVALTRLSKSAVVPVIAMARPGAHVWRA
jgi:NAD(P)-dependent dehydrogenase (short-subunit alcohol dehydrogenase family)